MTMFENAAMPEPLATVRLCHDNLLREINRLVRRKAEDLLMKDPTRMLYLEMNINTFLAGPRYVVLVGARHICDKSYAITVTVLSFVKEEGDDDV